MRSRALDNLFRGNHFARRQVDSGRAEGIRQLTLELASRLDIFVVDRHEFIEELKLKIVRPAVYLMERFIRDQYDYQVNLDLFTPSDLDPLGEDAEVRFRETLTRGSVEFYRVQPEKVGYTKLPHTTAANMQVEKLCGWTPALMDKNRPSLGRARDTRILVKQKMIVIGKKSPKTRVNATFMSRLAKQRTKEGKPRFDFYASLVPYTMRIQVETAAGVDGGEPLPMSFNSDDSMHSPSSYEDFAEDMELDPTSQETFGSNHMDID